MKMFITGLALLVIGFAFTSSFAPAQDVRGEPVAGEELRNGVWVIVPLRHDPPPPARVSRERSASLRDGSTAGRPAIADETQRQEQIYREAIQLLKPIDRIPEIQKYPTRGSVVLKPTGTAFFNALGRSGDRSYESVAQVLGDTPFVPSKSAAEDLYRTAYLLGAAAKATGADDARFLADQAGLAINAQPILVVIPERAATPEMQGKIEKMEQLKSEALEVQRTFAQAKESWTAATKELDRANAAVEKQKNELEQVKARAKEQAAATSGQETAPNPEASPDVQQAKANLKAAQQALQRATAHEAKTKANMATAKEELKKRMLRFVDASVAN